MADPIFAANSPRVLEFKGVTGRLLRAPAIAPIQSKKLRPGTGSTNEFMAAPSLAIIAGPQRWNSGRRS